MRFFRFILPMLLVLALSTAALAAADPTPLIVDGSGSELGNTPTPVTAATPTPPPESGSSTGDTSTATETPGADTGSDDEGSWDEGAGDEEWTDEPLYEKKQLTAYWQGVSYNVQELGTAVTVLKTLGGLVTVPTRDLTFETEEAAGRQLAIIDAPKTGKATMHKTTSANSTVIKKCDTGTVVTVLKYGKKRSKILYEDAEGYVLTSALDFCTAQESDSFTFAYIAYNGNVKSRNTVKTRMNGSSNSRTLGEYPCGTLVTVFSVDDAGKWTEIEVAGSHCWILSEFLTEAEGIIVASSGSSSAAGSPAATESPAPSATPEPPSTFPPES